VSVTVSVSDPANGRKLIKAIFRPVLDFLYSPFCILCDTRLTEEESRVCTQCWSSFKRINLNDEAYLDLKGKFRNDGIVTDCFAPFLFEKDGTLQHVLHHLKYNGYTSFGVKLGIEVGKGLLQNNIFGSADIIVPVPLHKVKRRERGYNQSEYICKGIALVTKISHLNSLMTRTRFTVTQTHLDLEQRNENVANAFSVQQKYRNTLSGKNVILVDDVVTTGSTISSCARELKKYGVSNIFSVSVAHGM